MAGLITAPRIERLEAGVIVAAMQVLERRCQLALGPIDLVVIDEAQHAVAAAWKRVLGRFDGARWLGVTATRPRASTARASATSWGARR